jgi:O-antigen/teichoic acid export membrane protein
MSYRNLGSVALVIFLGLVIGVLGIVENDLYTVGVLILIIGGVGAAVIAGEYLIKRFSSRQPPA